MNALVPPAAFASLEAADRRLLPGDRLPRLSPRTASRPSFAIDTLAGRYVLLCFLGSASDAAGRTALEALRRERVRFDDVGASVFAVSADPADDGRLRDEPPGLRFVLDFDGEVARACGMTTAGAPRRGWILIDPTLHVLATFPLTDAGAAGVFALLDELPPPGGYAGFEIPAPVLVLPRVFEPDLCGHLIDLYEAAGGAESGVMRGGVGVLDAGFKRRRDHTIEDQPLIGAIQARVMRRVVPEIERLFFMKITRMERYLVGCYAAEDGGHFAPHRDNTQGITAHRRFAVSINLNDGFDGGAVSFPEYAMRGYKAPPGWAVVFPANILHAVGRVTTGRRYAFLPFVFDESGARVRSAEAAKRAAGG